MGSALKRPPGRLKTKAAKAAGTAATKPNTPASSNYSKLVASSEAIAASIRYKSKMEMLMKEAEMYFRFGEKDKALEIMAKVEHLCQLEEGKEDPMPKPLSHASTPLPQTNTPDLPMYMFVPVVQWPDDVVYAQEDEIPRPTTPEKV
jgi:hypothetical protein